MMLLVLNTGGKLFSRGVVISQNPRRLCSVQVRTTYDGGIDLYAGPYRHLGCH